MKHFTVEIQDDLHHLQAIGHGAVSLFNAAVLLAVVAVILSTRSSAADMINKFFELVSWLVKQVLTPVAGQGYNVPLTSKLAPAFGGATSGGDSTGGGSSPAPSSGTGTTSAPTPPAYPVVDPQTGIVTGTSRDPLYPGQIPYIGLNPDGSPRYATGTGTLAGQTSGGGGEGGGGGAAGDAGEGGGAGGAGGDGGGGGGDDA